MQCIWLQGCIRWSRGLICFVFTYSGFSFRQKLTVPYPNCAKCRVRHGSPPGLHAQRPVASCGCQGRRRAVEPIQGNTPLPIPFLGSSSISLYTETYSNFTIANRPELLQPVRQSPWRLIHCHYARPHISGS